MPALALTLLLTLATCLAAPPPAVPQDALAPDTGSGDPSPAALDSVFHGLDSTHPPAAPSP